MNWVLTQKGIILKNGQTLHFFKFPNILKRALNNDIRQMHCMFGGEYHEN